MSNLTIEELIKENEQLRKQLQEVSLTYNKGVNTQNIKDKKQLGIELKKEKQHYYSLFNDSPLPLWEEDFSEVKQFIDSLKKNGVNDFRAYFNNNPEDVTKCIEMVKIKDVNKAAISLHEATSKEELLKSLNLIFTDKSLECFKEELIAIAEKRTIFEFDTEVKTLRGELIDIKFSWNFASEHEESMKKIIISSINITRDKQYLDVINLQKQQLNQIYNFTTDILYSLKVEPKSQFRFITMNNVGLNATGLTKEQFVGKTIEDVIPEPSLQLVRANYIKAIQEKKTVTWEESSDYPSGTKTGIVSINPIFDDNGNCTHLIGTVHDITEIKNTLKLLKDSEERWDLTVNASKDGIWDWDIVSNKEYFSPQWWSILGYTQNDIPLKASNKIWENLIHPEDKDYVIKALTNHLEHGNIYDVEYRLLHKSGEYRWLQSIGKAICNENNKPIRMVGCIRDINEKKLSINKLKEFEYIVSSSKDMIALLDTQYNYTYVNKTYAKAFKLTPDQLIGKTITEVFGETFFNSTIKNNADKCLTGKIVNYKEWFHFPAYDEPYFMDITYYPFYDNDHKILGFFVNANNNTEIKKSSDSIKSSKQLFKDMINNTDGIVWEADAQTFKFDYVSEKAERLLGFAIEDWYKEGFWANHIYETDREQAIKYCISHTKKKLPHDFEYRFVTKSGEIVWLRDLVSVVTKDGKPHKLRGIMIDITKQKQTEKKLIESETRFKALHNASFGGIAIHDKGIILECNQGMSDISGYTYDELIGMDGLLLITEKHRKRVLDNVLSGYEKPYVVDGLRKNGKEFPMQVEARNVPYKGKTARTVEFRDITEQKNAELQLIKAKEEIEKSEEKFKAIAKYSPNLIFTINRNGEIQYINRVVKGIKLGNVIGTSMYPFINVEYHNLVKSCIEDVFKNGKTRYYETKGVGPNDTISDYLSNVGPIYGEDKEIKLAIISTQDITEQKRVEEKINNLNSQLNISIASMPNAYILLDTNLHVIEWNNAAKKIFGYSKQEILGKNPVNYIVPKKDRAIVDNVLKNLKVGEVSSYTAKDNNIRKDGKIISCYWSNAPLLNENDTVFGILILAQDITKQLLAEEELSKQHENLEELVKTRTKELEAKNAELNTAVKVFVGREMKIRKLEKEIKLLKNET